MYTRFKNKREQKHTQEKRIEKQQIYFKINSEETLGLLKKKFKGKMNKALNLKRFH